jgi:hypothetical protein
MDHRVRDDDRQVGAAPQPVEHDGDHRGARSGAEVRAFRYDASGALVPCADVGPEFREPVPVRQSLAPRSPTTKRERRRFARVRSGRGRRRARKVGPVVPPREQLRRTALAFTVYRGHLLGNGEGKGALLYLPEGAEVTDADCSRADRAFAKVIP